MNKPYVRRGRITASIVCSAVLLGASAYACGSETVTNTVTHQPTATVSAVPSTAPSLRATLPQTVTDMIRSMSDNLLARTGVKPLEAEFYATDETTALAALETPQPTAGQNPVYVLVYRGDFELKLFSGPPGASRPRASIAVYVVDAQTGDTVLFGVQSQPPDQARLGPMTRVPIE